MADITGTNASETLTGGAGNDTIRGLGGNDWLFGVGGNDSLYGGEGNDRLWGGDGNDRLWGRDGDDRLNAGAGNGLQRLYGGAGNDTMTGVSATGAVQMFGGKGRDTVVIGPVLFDGSDFVDGGGDHDTFIGSALTADMDINLSDLLLRADGISATLAGFETIYCGKGNDTVYGGGEGIYVYDMSIYGDVGDDVLYLVDTLSESSLCGGIGNDTLGAGSGGFISAYGGAGKDVIEYYSVNEDKSVVRLYGGTGNDTLVIATPRAVTVDLGKGRLGEESRGFSALMVAQGFENVTGNSGNDTLSGSRGTNTLLGVGGDDSLTGRAGADDLQGGAGADLLFGGAGADTLLGGNGADTMTGGGGADLFWFAAATDAGTTAATQDVITDFGTGADKLYLADLNLTFIGTEAFGGNAGEVRYVIADGNTSVRIDTDGDGARDMTILLQGVAAGVTAGDLIL